MNASACIHEQDLGKVLKYILPNIVSNIKSYTHGSYYLFPTYHGCCYRNKNGTRKKMEYNRGEQCTNPDKKKYLGNPLKVYPTRYRKIYFKNIKNLFLTQMLSYS